MNLLKQLKKLLVPYYCVICGLQTNNSYGICDPCFSDLPWLTHYCARCSNPLINSNNLLCGSCLKSKLYYDKIISLFHYRPPISQLITQFKFHKKLHLSRNFSQLIVSQLNDFINTSNIKFDIVIPVPLHRKRIKERGFNQANEIAKLIAKKLQILLANNVVVRVKNTSPQTELPSKQRKRNVKNAFFVQGNIQDKNILIIDDVITTGATVNELSRVLKKSGADHIVVCSLTRSSPDSN